MVRANFSTRVFGWKFRGILGNLFGGWEGIWEWNLKVLPGPWKCLEFWEVSSLLSTAPPEKKENHRIKIQWKQGWWRLKPPEQKALRIPVTFENPAKKASWASLVFHFLKICPSNRAGLSETVQSTHWKKSPTHEMIHRFSTPVQSKSNRTHKILQNPQKINASQKGPTKKKISTRYFWKVY